ncbi:hypothetical protein BUALT_Bualt04G0083700 [Buddleja alternifolia]|uniref:Protein PLASTID MOVEMENT IMPAIRED 2 n=1 Tax=Buddleja alternifolia TaxID=168488 RepID=A0AAV6XNN3_9LAMI|nr:hypothetical protein BUALT_Bualt04G0083700 [Buddleja alternifolia]
MAEDLVTWQFAHGSHHFQLTGKTLPILIPEFLKNSAKGVSGFGVLMDDKKIGSVKAVISSYGERIVEGNFTTNKFQTNYPENYTKTRELHQAKRDTNKLNESRKLAESVTAEAESKLVAANKTVKDLALRIEESRSKAKAQIKSEERESDSGNSMCAKVMRELKTIKRELSKLKLDMASVLEEKRRVEKETESSLSKTESYSSSLVTLRKEIEEINEEHVLIELARIEAIKEYEAIEAQRREKAEKYLGSVAETQNKKQNMAREVEDTKEMESKLAITISDINMLQSELNQIKEMDKGVQRNDVITELEAAKKELASIKEESFQFMASMDVVRNEIMHVADEKARLKKKEEKTETIIQNLNSKLLKAKAKLEWTSAAEDKTRSVVSNLTATLQQLTSEAETAKNERSLISEETAVLKAEVQRIETEIDLGEEKLQAALQELKAVKSSEAIALDNLKALIESTMRNRASTSRATSNITISKFEYEYLTGHAVGAREIADKKVAAAQAWIEALKASEKEILVKTEILRREYREMKVQEEREVQKNEGIMNVKKLFEDEMVPEKVKAEITLHSKGVNRSGKMTPARRAKGRKSASPVVRGTPRSKSFTVKRRKQVMPNLGKFFGGKSSERNL